MKLTVRKTKLISKNENLKKYEQLSINANV